MSSEFYCKYCAITCTGKAPFEQHLQSAKHLKKAKENPSSPSSEQSRSPNISPRLITYSSASATNTNIPEDSSISSASYPISQETMRILLEWNHPRGYKPYCDICQLPLHGENNADLHFSINNNIHNQKLAAWKTIHEGDARYSCTVCSELFSNENIMREHFYSDSHTNMVQQKTNLKKIIQIYQTYEQLKQERLQRKSKFKDRLQ
jgi:hypothetical protein